MKQDHKKYPHCGQTQIPLKMGVCVCGKQDPIFTVSHIKGD
ncbi:MAG: hypothetical protein OEX98_02805 [Nitrosopumilus sp.]|nr:hypothetical protein [Nitrosopumilus sp.]